MKLSGGEIVARALADEGVALTFGIPGTHNIELYDALAASEAVTPVLVTDEQSASFMADGHWRASRRLATSFASRLTRSVSRAGWSSRRARARSGGSDSSS